MMEGRRDESENRARDNDGDDKRNIKRCNIKRKTSQHFDQSFLKFVAFLIKVFIKV